MSRRVDRVNSVIRQEICDLLQREVKDPRLGTFVTVTRVSTSADFRHAKVYVSTIGSDRGTEEVLGALGRASGFLRREMGRRLDLRRVPELSFQYDESIGQGVRILQLISEVSGPQTEAEGPREP